MKRLDIAIFLAIYAVGVTTVFLPGYTTEDANTTDGEDVVVVTVSEPTPTTTPQQTVQLHSELMPVCSCESIGNPYEDPLEYHYEEDGETPLVGRVNPLDRGMCQIHLPAHLKTATDMGLDILNNIDDYIIYSNWLYETQGLTPWRYSQACWGI